MVEALITGATSGFGRLIADRAISSGAHVIAVGRRADRLADLSRSAPEGRVTRISLDITGPDVQQRLAAAIESAGGLDVLVNNAGYGLFGSVEQTGDEAVRAVLETNVLANLAGRRRCGPGATWAEGICAVLLWAYAATFRASEAERSSVLVATMGGSTVTPSRVSATRECYATALRKASRRLTALYDEALAPAGLRSTQYAILRELEAGGAMTINELAEVLVLDRSGLGHSLRPLQRDGWIALDRGTADRRSVQVVLTEPGRRRFDQASALWSAAQERVVAVLGAAATEPLRQQLNSIAEDDRLS